MSTVPAETDAVIIHPYYPDGVSYILATGGSNYVGFVDKNTVLKYPHDPEDRELLEVEASIYAALPYYPRILEYKGQTEHGLLLGLASNGSLAALIHKNSQLSRTLRMRLALQASEAVAYIHAHSVLHCDLNASNFLINENFDLLLCDFQGRLLRADGSVYINGGVSENAKSRMPNKADDEADMKTDIFALGSMIYHIMQSHEPFPHLDPFEDEITIKGEFESHKLPDLEPTLAGEVVHKCWKGAYTSAEEVVRDLEALNID